jgi:hypothetical protein
VANIEAARQETAVLYSEMQEAGRHLVICMPTDPKALVDLLMYMERHFSILPQEINGQRSWGLLGGMARGRPRDFRRQPITAASLGGALKHCIESTGVVTTSTASQVRVSETAA